jgi:hypothetical protein
MDVSENSGEVLRHALGYAARGVGVLPLRARAKEPLLEHGVHDASREATTIRSWWRRWPGANLALAVPASWVVVDIDPRNGGDRELARLQQKHGELPPTVTARTGSGGSHFVFARPADVRLRGKLGPGIDLLGAGRYIVAAPSVHPCGGVYRWISPPRIQIAHAPQWLIGLARVRETSPAPVVRSTMHARPEVIDRARRYLEQVPGAIEGSGGSTHTFVTAQRLVRGFGLAEAEAFALMTEWNSRCQPPWSARDLARKVTEAARAGRMPVGAMLERTG